MLTAASERLAAAAAGEAVQSRDHEEGLPFASDGHCRGTEDMCDGTDNEGRPELTMTMFNVPKVVSDVVCIRLRGDTPKYIVVM